MSLQKIRSTILLVAFLGIALASLSSCSFPTKYERDPSKVGYGRDAFKQSKCACLLLYENGIWLG